MKKNNVCFRAVIKSNSIIKYMKTAKLQKCYLHSLVALDHFFSPNISRSSKKRSEQNTQSSCKATKNKIASESASRVTCNCVIHVPREKFWTRATWRCLVWLELLTDWHWHWKRPDILRNRKEESYTRMPRRSVSPVRTYFSLILSAVVHTCSISQSHWRMLIGRERDYYTRAAICLHDTRFEVHFSESFHFAVFINDLVFEQNIH